MDVDGVRGEHGGARERSAYGPVPLDAELTAVRAARGERGVVTPENLADVQARDIAARPRPTAEELGDGGRFEVTELKAPGPPGAPDVTLVYGRPADAAGPLPVLYYMHGGGMVMGNAWSVLPRVLRDWTAPLGLAVLSVEYRLAPQTQYPAPLEDCYAGLTWAAEQSAELGLDPARILVGGKSAGAGLAAALALLTRDRGGPAPIGQLLMSPMLDDRDERFSTRQMADVDTVDSTSKATFWHAYLGNRYGTDDVPPYAAAGRAGDLSALPPAYIDVGSAENFRDDAVAYADALWRTGLDAELHVWPGAFHGYDSIAAKATISQDATEARTRWLRRILDR
ncbi:alpha/beta hydrolase [Streptomyces sp. NPDC048629]|uniref:alpha/beta hydrolase n=1 Tax=Streptomyces sp. NPDC048629 TaxID=3154824 RepID=UPI003441D907